MVKIETVKDAINYIHGRHKWSKTPTFERLNSILTYLGHPEKRLQYVHVTGTNGKGSTSKMIAQLLRASGLKVGLFTSPYILKFNERIQDDQGNIDDDDLLHLVQKLAPIIDEFDKQLTTGLTEFETLTVLMFMYFFEYVRSEHAVGIASEYSPLLGFFVRQGTSINVIKYAELFEERLNPDAYYSLYNTLKWLQDSWIDYLLNLNLNFEFGRQSLETAISGTSLADFVSYNANPTTYLTGMGYGSCYIEELYVDFGYIGVFLGNVIYGILLCVLLKNAVNKGNIWKIAIGLFMIDAIFKAPRATFDAFWGSFLYFNSWGPFLLIFIFVNVYMTKNNRSVR